MEDKAREEALREIYNNITPEERDGIMQLQVARRDQLAIKVLKEFGTREPDYQSARAYVAANFEGSPIWEEHRRAGTGLTDID